MHLFLPSLRCMQLMCRMFMCKTMHHAANPTRCCFVPVSAGDPPISPPPPQPEPAPPAPCPSISAHSNEIFAVYNNSETKNEGTLLKETFIMGDIAAPLERDVAIVCRKQNSPPHPPPQRPLGHCCMSSSACSCRQVSAATPTRISREVPPKLFGVLSFLGFVGWKPPPTGAPLVFFSSYLYPTLSYGNMDT